MSHHRRVSLKSSVLDYSHEVSGDRQPDASINHWLVPRSRQSVVYYCNYPINSWVNKHILLRISTVIGLWWWVVVCNVERHDSCHASCCHVAREKQIDSRTRVMRHTLLITTRHWQTKTSPPPHHNLETRRPPGGQNYVNKEPHKWIKMSMFIRILYHYSGADRNKGA